MASVENIINKLIEMIISIKNNDILEALGKIISTQLADLKNENLIKYLGIMFEFSDEYGSKRSYS
jgi:DNA modification methylase